MLFSRDSYGCLFECVGHWLYCKKVVSFICMQEQKGVRLGGISLKNGKSGPGFLLLQILLHMEGEDQVDVGSGWTDGF